MKIVKWAFLIFLVLFFVTKAHLVSYLLMQGQGQLEVLWNARPVEDFLDDETVDKELKSKIRLIEEIKAFADTELGLKSEGLYTTIYDQQGEDILWNVTACEPYALKSVEWTFPIVGCVSYKGFFDLEKAKYEAQSLKEKGFDIRIRPVNAWSTLGWFSDPILSKNLKREEGALAELFIHEITHANIFLKDSLTFNENLASFIGEHGALQYLVEKYGRSSDSVEYYVQSEKDAQQFVNHCLRGVEDLRALYASFGSEMSEVDKVSFKEDYMRKWVSSLDSLPFYDQQAYLRRFEEELPNNAFFMAFDRYDSKKKDFAMQLAEDFGGDLYAFISFYKQEK